MASKKDKNITKKSLEEQADLILAKAEGMGVEAAYFFSTTFKRYKFQVQTMDNLEAEILENGVTVEKEYVKGRTNLYTNPAIAEYNKTATAANGTLSTLLKILTTLEETEGIESGDLMSEFLAL